MGTVFLPKCAYLGDPKLRYGRSTSVPKHHSCEYVHMQWVAPVPIEPPAKKLLREIPLADKHLVVEFIDVSYPDKALKSNLLTPVIVKSFMDLLVFLSWRDKL